MTVTLFGRFRFLCSALLGIFSLLTFSALAAGQGTPPLNQFTFNQGIAFQNSVSVTLSQQQAGGTNVVVVGWNDSSSTITSVADTNGNTYSLAAGVMDITSPDVSQAIYFARNINAGLNTVTVTFNAYVGAQDVRLIEYGVGSGINLVENTTNPLDTSVGATGNTTPAVSGSMTTAYGNDLLVVGGTISTGFSGIVKSCGTGCTMFNEIVGQAPFDDIVADAVVNATGTYQAMANQAGGGGGNYVLQTVALRVAGQATLTFPAPIASSVLPASSPEAGGVPITITGTGFLPGAVVTITDGTHTASAINCSVASSTTINCVTPVFPSPNASATVVVTNPDLQTASLPGLAYTGSTPFATAGGGDFSPINGPSNGGTRIQITGSDFASGATVTIGGTRADEVVVLNSTTIFAVAPAGSAGAQDIVVTNLSGFNGSPGGYTYAPGAGINFVQGSYAVPTLTSQPSAAFNLPQTAGDLNVVAIGWADTSATIQSVSDSAGNTYTLAVGPTQGNGFSQSIYYAKNIVNSSADNTVTVKFNQNPTTPDLRIVEYSGADTTNPLDGAAGAAGIGTFLDSGPVTTTGVGDMILGAGIVAGAITPALGKACADPSCLYSTAVFTRYADNVINTFPTVAGPFDATANQTPAGDAWVMQAVAIKAAGGSVASFSMAATALSPASVPAGSSATSTVTVTPSGGFSSPVTLTCTGLPSGALCNFVPPSVTPGASAVTSALTITTTGSTPVGTSTVTITGTSGAVTATTTVSLVVTGGSGGGSFTLAPANPVSGTVSAGASTSSTITVIGSGGFTGTVTLGCSVAPLNAPAPVCSLGPGSVPLSSTTTSATATLTVSTTAATASLRHSSSIFYALLLPIGGMALLGAGFGSRRKKVLGVLLVFLMASGLLFLASCSSGSSSGGGGGGGHAGTPAGTYTVTITATGGGVTATPTTFTLTVQ